MVSLWWLPLRLHGIKHLSDLVSMISGGMICGTLGLAGMCKRGTPLHVLQELGGWKSAQMVRRYAHFSAGHLALHAANLPVLIAARVGGESGF